MKKLHIPYDLFSTKFLRNHFSFSSKIKNKLKKTALKNEILDVLFD